MSSEFVHEDYVGIGYDFIRLRIELVDYYFYLLKNSIVMIKDAVKIKKLTKYFDLFDKE